MSANRVIIIAPMLLTAVLGVVVMFCVLPNMSSEDIRIISKYAQWVSSQVQYEVVTEKGILKKVSYSNFWEITIHIKSTGASPAKILGITISHRDIDSYDPKIICISKVDDNPRFLTYKISIKPGETATLTLIIPFNTKINGHSLNHGELIDIRIFTQTKEKAISLVIP